MLHDLLAFSIILCSDTYRNQSSAPEDWICASRKTKRFGPRCVPEFPFNYSIWIASVCDGDHNNCIEGNSIKIGLCDCIAEFCGSGGVVVGRVERGG